MLCATELAMTVYLFFFPFVVLTHGIMGSNLLNAHLGRSWVSGCSVPALHGLFLHHVSMTSAYWSWPHSPTITHQPSPSPFVLQRVTGVSNGMVDV